MSRPFKGKFSRQESATVSAAGTATVQLKGPYPIGSYYDIDSIALSCASTTLPTAKLYKSPVVGDRLIATNLNGSSGSFDRTGESDRMEHGDAWTVYWENATVGVVATATMHGIEYRP